MYAFLLSLALLQAHEVPTPAAQVAERERFEAILITTPTDPIAQQGEVQVSEKIALAEMAAGDPTSALADLLRAQKFAPQDTHLLYDTGVLEEQLGLLHDADETLERLRRIAP